MRPMGPIRAELGAWKRRETSNVNSAVSEFLSKLRTQPFKQLYIRGPLPVYFRFELLMKPIPSAVTKTYGQRGAEIAVFAAGGQ
jgi:hypothetical protein